MLDEVPDEIRTFILERVEPKRLPFAPYRLTPGPSAPW